MPLLDPSEIDLVPMRSISRVYLYSATGLHGLDISLTYLPLPPLPLSRVLLSWFLSHIFVLPFSLPLFLTGYFSLDTC